MAKTLTAFPEEGESQKRGRYPWDQWLDGQPWELRRGTRAEVQEKKADYSVTTKSFSSAAKQAATGRKGDVRTAVQDEGNTMVIQFVPDDAPAEASTDE